MSVLVCSQIQFCFLTLQEIIRLCSAPIQVSAKALLVALLAIVAIAGFGCRSEEKTSYSDPEGIARESEIYFSANDSWPPQIRNNPVQEPPPGQFFTYMFNKCRNGIGAFQSTRSIASAGQFTGIEDTNVQAFACNESDLKDLLPPSFIQFDDESKRIGIWVNSTGMTGGPNIYLTTAAPVMYFGPKFPWSKPDGKVQVSFKMRVAHWEWSPPNDGKLAIPYAQVWLLLERPDSWQRMWYGVTAFDPRPCYEWVQNDEWGDNDGTLLPIVQSCLYEDSTFVRLGAGSDVTQTDAYSDEKHFSFEIQRDDLGKGIAAYNAWASANGHQTWESDVAGLSQYKVIAVVLTAEISDGDDSRASVLEISPENVFPETIGMEIWIQRDPAAGWQWASNFNISSLSDAPLEVDMSNVAEFQGNLTALAFNPVLSEASEGRIGIGYFLLRNNYKQVVRNWTMTNLEIPLPLQFRHDSSLYTLWHFGRLWTDGIRWSGSISPGLQPSIQVTQFKPVKLENSGNLGVSFSDIVVSHDTAP